MNASSGCGRDLNLNNMGKVKGVFAGNISGRVGNVVFRANGSTNIVAQRPASVKNPRTSAQQMQRAIIKSTSAAYSLLRSVCDHSFEGVSYGQKSMNYFNKINSKVIADSGSLVLKNSTSVAPPSAIVVAKGSLLSALSQKVVKTDKGNVIVLGDLSAWMKSSAIEKVEDITVSQLLSFLGIEYGNQFTIMNVLPDGSSYEFGEIKQIGMESVYSRYIFKMGDSPVFNVISGEGGTKFYSIKNVCLSEESQISTRANLCVINITVDKITGPQLAICMDLSSSNVNFGSALASTYIISRKSGMKWKRSTSVLVWAMDAGNNYAADYVVQSYDPESEYYLNNAQNAGASSSNSKPSGPSTGGSESGDSKPSGPSTGGDSTTPPSGGGGGSDGDGSEG